MTLFALEHGRQCMQCSAKFSVTLQTEILSAETSAFLKRIIFLNSLNSVLLAFIPGKRHIFIHCGISGFGKLQRGC